MQSANPSADNALATSHHCPNYRLHGELAAGVVRDSAAAVSRELLECYELIERLGRGAVFYGSARLKQAGSLTFWAHCERSACAAMRSLSAASRV